MNEDEQVVLDKIKEMMKDNDVHIFSDKEVKTLKRIIAIIDAFYTLGGLGTVIKNTLMWLGFMIGAYIAAKNGVVGWIVGLK